jgi:glycosyltransferase involved in cell wall biosynthesis
MISFVIPSYNNLRHLKNAYSSLKRNEPDAELIIIDDASTDGTLEWLRKIEKTDDNVIVYRVEERLGHTILYNLGIGFATNDVVGIMHADMLVGPNYSKNLLKHLKRGKVVCATRVEPPLHPAGKEKIIRNFGMDFDTLNIDEFETFCIEEQIANEDLTTNGMFAPWVIYKEDFQRIGGHDPLFAPFPLEDSDIFQRWMLAGYELIQSRDSLVYHLTCRGHRWTEEIGKDDEYYKTVTNRATKNYIRKWGSWIQNDEYQHPVIIPKYGVAFSVTGANLDAVATLEPFCDRLYVEDEMRVLFSYYYDMEQKNTLFDLEKRVMTMEYNRPHACEDIVVEFNWKEMSNQSMQIIHQLPHIIQDSGEIGQFVIDIFTITIHRIVEYQSRLINLNDEWYVNKLKNKSVKYNSIL